MSWSRARSTPSCVGSSSSSGGLGKTDALRGQLGPPDMVSTLLLLRSTVATRAIAKAYEATLAAAFPVRCSDAVAALRGEAAWPGAAVLWARLQGDRAEILDLPPRGIRLGR
jgi:hypothetical protein